MYSLSSTARSQFALKTAELIFATQNYGQMIAKARVMAAFYPDELPSGFAAKLEDNDLLRDLAKQYPDSHMDSKIELLKEIVAHPEQEDKILLRWEWMFPDDKAFLDEYRAERANGKGK